jgi:hypothetical protein
MKLAGVIIDFYDDISGSELKSVYPTADKLPEIIKTAHILNPDERAILRDEAYALIVQDEGKVFRKFACVDPGNTLLSLLYFQKSASLLPEEAQKVAAKNIYDRAVEFGILKEGSKTPMTKRRDPMQTPVVGDEADWASRTNLLSIMGSSDTGRVSSSVAQGMKTAGAEGATAVETNDSTRLDQQSTGGSATKVVDVTNKKAKTTVKKASPDAIYALGNKYPLDSYANVQRAVSYFDEHWTKMPPDDRHEYAVKTASRADELGIRYGEILERYGSKDYALDLDAHLSSRKAVVEQELAGIYDELQEKRASIEPEVFARVLHEIDKSAGLDAYYGGAIQDHIWSTFGATEKDKVANWSWMSPIGTHITSEDLLWLARNGKATLEKHFTKEVVGGLVENPFVVFDSLPNDSKEIIARLASDRFSGISAN